MAFPEQWLKSTIEAAAGCQAFPLIAPEAVAPPYMVYMRSGTDRPLSMGNGAFTFNPSAVFQVEIYAPTYVAAKTVADAVREAAHNFNGTAYGVTIRQCLLTDERDGDPVFFDGQDKPTFLVEHVYQIRWEE